MNNDQIIKVFPAVNRTTNLESRWLNEPNLTNLVNQLLDKESFLISDTLDDVIKFNIHGYYFEIYTAALTEDAASNTAKAVYASIILD